ncbi:hypothetical protein HDU80_002327 [Chytriomyces hyalinus]|nr:hypothetical protein HDU80_002327 [Chytriomyces hyalinus]
MNKAGPSGSPPSCADQVLAKLCPIRPAPKTPSMAYDPLHAPYTPAESIMQLPPAIQLYRFDRCQELQTILKVLAHLFRPTEKEETKMYKHLFEALEDQNVRRYYELKAQQLHRKAYPESLTVFGRKGVPQAANQRLYPSQFPSPASKRGASAPSTPTPIRSGSPQFAFFSDASANSTDDELERPALQTLTAVVVQELYFKIQDQKSGTCQQGLTPLQTPNKRVIRDQKDKIVADRANKKIKQYLTEQFQASSQPDAVQSSDTAHVASSPRTLHISQLPKRSNSLPKTPRKSRAIRLAYPASYSQALPVTRQFSNPFLESPLSSPALSSQVLPSSNRHFSNALLQSPLSSPLLPPQTSRQCSNMLLQSPLSSPALSSQSFPAAYQFSNHFLQPPMVAFKPLDVQNTMMLDHSFGFGFDFDSASLPRSIQGPQADLLNSMPANPQNVGDFQAMCNNDMAMYFYNKGFEYAQARHNESIGPSQDAFWLCVEPQSNPLSSPARVPPTNILDAGIYDALRIGHTGRGLAHETSEPFLNGATVAPLNTDSTSSSIGMEDTLSHIMDIISFDS